MSERTERQQYNVGGFIPGGPTRFTLHPDECVAKVGDERVVCVRADHQDRACSGPGRSSNATAHGTRLP